jgi:BlaI family transcriptional regulator, penicillinase repressor
LARDPLHLSRRQRQIMEAIYAAGQASAADVTAALSDPPSNTAVRTLLRILEEKGHLTHEKRGREFIYRPTRPRGHVARGALRRLLATFFDHSLERALASYMTDPRTKLTEDELRRISDLIDQARRNSK